MAVRAVPALVPAAPSALPVRELGEDGVPGRRVLVRRLAGLRDCVHAKAASGSG